jgi:hypothetical protein
MTASTSRPGPSAPGRHRAPDAEPVGASRRSFLRVGAAAGAGTLLGAGLLASPADAASSATTVQTTQVVVVDSADDLPPGTPAGTLVVVRS